MNLHRSQDETLKSVFQVLLFNALSPEKVGPHARQTIEVHKHGNTPNLVTADQVLEHRANKV